MWRLFGVPRSRTRFENVPVRAEGAATHIRQLLDDPGTAISLR